MIITKLIPHAALQYSLCHYVNKALNIIIFAYKLFLLLESFTYLSTLMYTEYVSSLSFTITYHTNAFRTLWYKN